MNSILIITGYSPTPAWLSGGMAHCGSSFSPLLQRRHCLVRDSYLESRLTSNVLYTYLTLGRILFTLILDRGTRDVQVSALQEDVDS